MVFGANSRTSESSEQSEWTRKSTRSVEVTVETDEFVFYQNVDRQSSETAPVEQPDKNGQAEASSNAVRKELKAGEILREQQGSGE